MKTFISTQQPAISYLHATIISSAAIAAKADVDIVRMVLRKTGLRADRRFFVFVRGGCGAELGARGVLWLHTVAWF